MGAEQLQAEAAQATNWMANESLDGKLAALARLQPAPNGRVEITALWLERKDGAPLAVRDFGAAHLGELQQSVQNPFILGSLSGVRDKGDGVYDAGNRVQLHPITAPPRRSGPGGMPPEHWDAVRPLWLEAREVAPDRATTWMQERWAERYGERIPIATMARWRERVKKMIDDEGTTS